MLSLPEAIFRSYFRSLRRLGSKTRFSRPGLFLGPFWGSTKTHTHTHKTKSSYTVNTYCLELRAYPGGVGGSGDSL